jgi:tetratricopeptide (TPR) repeat protein
MSFCKFILFLIFSSLLYGQSSICGISPIEKNIVDCLIEKPNINILNDKILKYITDEIGIAPNFVLKYCANTANAVAVINPFQKNKRYILFDGEYFSRLYNNDKYSAVFIIAHEVGHHLNGHTIPSTNENILDLQKQELESDYFAGFIMFRLGATENDIIKTINKFPEPDNDFSSHPKNHKRINYALKGFLNETNKYKSELYRIKDLLKNDINKENKEREFEELIKSINNFAIENDIKHLNVAEYLINKIDDGSIVFIDLKAYINYKKGNYKDALDFYIEEFKKNKTFIDFAQLIDIISNLNINDSSINNILIDVELNSNEPRMLLDLGIYYNQNNNYIKGRNILKKAYQLIKNSEYSLLQSDIFYAYGRALYNEQLALENRNFNFAKLLLQKSKLIIENYPNDIYYRKFYNSILFHIGNIYKMEKDNDNAILTYKQLLFNKLENNDYKYKSNASIGLIYLENEKFPEAIQYFTNAINSCDNNEYLKDYYFLRGKTYVLNNNYEIGFDDFKISCKYGNKESCDIVEGIKK